MQRGARGAQGDTPSEISLYTLRNHCTCAKFGALDHRVTVKTVTDWTISTCSILEAVCNST